MSDATENSQNSEAQNQTPNGADVNSAAPSELQKAQEDAAKWKNDYLYLKAEFENYKRHAIKERSDTLKYSGEKVFRDLLPVLDNFERALQVQASAENLSTYVKGVELTANQIRELLARHGVVEVPSEGQPFDPAVHEALTSEATDAVAPGHVFRVFQRAYKYHEKLLRPGQVVVAKKPE